MRKKLKIAITLNLTVATISILVGFMYLISTDLTNYHKAVIGADVANITPNIEKLLLILMKGTGDAVFITGITILVMTLIPLKRGENWARWSILTIGMTCYIPMFFGAAYLASTTGAPSPWWLNALIILLLIASFAISKATLPSQKPSQKTQFL